MRLRRIMKNLYIYSIIGIIIVALVSYGVYKIGKTNTTAQPIGAHVITVVAAENFYGDIVKQLGGNHVQVLSILSDPNADPHEYESSVRME